jgi:hypothetical protein
MTLFWNSLREELLHVSMYIQMQAMDKPMQTMSISHSVFFGMRWHVVCQVTSNWSKKIFVISWKEWAPEPRMHGEGSNMSGPMRELHSFIYSCLLQVSRLHETCFFKCLHTTGNKFLMEVVKPGYQFIGTIIFLIEVMQYILSLVPTWNTVVALYFASHIARVTHCMPILSLSCSKDGAGKCGGPSNIHIVHVRAMGHYCLSDGL